MFKFNVNQRVTTTANRSEFRRDIMTGKPDVGEHVTVTAALPVAGGEADPMYQVMRDDGRMSLVFESEVEANRPHVIVATWNDANFQGMTRTMEVFGPFDDLHAADTWLDVNQSWWSEQSDPYFQVMPTSGTPPLNERDTLLESTEHIAPVIPIGGKSDKDKAIDGWIERHPSDDHPVS